MQATLHREGVSEAAKEHAREMLEEAVSRAYYISAFPFMLRFHLEGRRVHRGEGDIGLLREFHGTTTTTTSVVCSDVFPTRPSLPVILDIVGTWDTESGPCQIFA
jgi:hypothetical protein